MYVEKEAYFQDMEYIEMKLESMQKLIDNITKTQIELLTRIKELEANDSSET